MKLLRGLPTRQDNRGRVVSYGLFLCELCGREVERQLSAGRNQISCGCLRKPARDNAELVRRGLMRMEAGGELSWPLAMLARRALSLLLAGSLEAEALAAVLCRFFHESDAGTAVPYGFSQVRTAAGETAEVRPPAMLVVK